MNAFDTPFVIPVAALAVGAVAIISGIASSMNSQRIRAEQRMAMIARGLSADDIVKLLGDSDEDARLEGRIKDPMRSLANARRAGIILSSIGIGLLLFFVVLERILQVREVYAGAASALIPLAIGVGFFVDYAWQKRDLTRFGLKIEPKQ
jgi:hypothetical protein